MKKILLLGALCCLISPLWAQHHDLKLNVGGLLAKTPGLFYEYGINPNHGVGAGINHSWLNVKVDGQRYNFRNTTFVADYRYYFIPRQDADRLFVGAYGKAGSGKISSEEDPETAKVNKMALGLSAGWKVVGAGGFIFEFYAGGGKTFLTSTSVANEDLDKAIKAIPLVDFRLGITVGYRFF